MPRNARHDEALKAVLRYQRTGNINDLEPALKYLNPLIEQRVSQFTDVEIPRYILKLEARKYVIEGLKKYNPRSGASLNTFAYDQLKRLRRFVINYQNTARIPEHIAMQVGQFQSAQRHLQEVLGREPSISELADYLGWANKRVEDLVKLQRREIIGQEDVRSSLSPYYTPEEDIPSILYYSLTPEEQLVYDMLTGSHGYKRHTIKETARKLRKPYSEVYKMKNSIARKLRSLRYYG